MALSLSQRFGLTRWSAGTDPLSRAQLDQDHARIDQLAAIDVQVETIAERPPPGVRSRYCWVVADRALFRDTGTSWHRISETDAAGGPLLRRFLTSDKAAGDAPSSYPSGLSTIETTAQGGWPAANLTVVTQRTANRIMQTATQVTTGRMWVRSGAASDAWGRFAEVAEQLQFTSTTRPTTNLFDGIRGYETDTAADVVYSSSIGDWIYTAFRGVPPMMSLKTFQGITSGAGLVHVQSWGQVADRSNGALSLASGDIVCNRNGSVRVRALAGSDAQAPGWSYMQIRLPLQEGSHLGALEDRRFRGSGFPSAGVLTQMLTEGPIAVRAGDKFSLWAQQFHNASDSPVGYDLALSVTYV